MKTYDTSGVKIKSSDKKTIIISKDKEHNKSIGHINLPLAAWIQSKVQTLNHRLFGSMGADKDNSLFIITESIHICMVNDFEFISYDQEIYGIDKYNCDHKNYSRILFHIHPKNIFGYPSTDDIIYLIRNKDAISSSVIGTKWGIWVITNNYNIKNLYNNLDIESRNLIKKIVQEQLDAINILTTDGNGGSRILISSDYIPINEIIIKIDKIMDVVIHLYPWDELVEAKVKIPVPY